MLDLDIFSRRCTTANRNQPEAIEDRVEDGEDEDRAILATQRTATALVIAIMAFREVRNCMVHTKMLFWISTGTRSDQ